MGNDRNSDCLSLNILSLLWNVYISKTTTTKINNQNRTKTKKKKKEEKDRRKKKGYEAGFQPNLRFHVT